MKRIDIDRPLVSFIVPCYNCSQYLDESIGSLLNQKQNSTKYEIIMVEDCSDDNGRTLAKCKTIVDDNKSELANIRLLAMKENKGLPGARNAGIAKAYGEYVGFIDADDAVNPYLMCEIVEALDTHPNADVVIWGCNENHFDSRGRVRKVVSVVPEDDAYISKPSIMGAAIQLEKQTLFGYMWNKIYKLSMVQEHRLMVPNERMIEDVLYNINAFNVAEQIVCIPKTLYEYQRRLNVGASITASYIPDYFEQFSKRVEYFYKWFKHTGYLNDDVKAVLANEYVRFTFSAIWRNRHVNSGLNQSAQVKWLNDYYNLQLTKDLLDYAKPEGKIAKYMAKSLQSKNVNKVMKQAAMIEFVTEHFSGLLIKLRQSR